LFSNSSHRSRKRPAIPALARAGRCGAETRCSLHLRAAVGSLNFKLAYRSFRTFREAVMPVVEVACPGCGAKLKAPDNMAGKKAKCKKCGKGFRIPGPPPASETPSDGQALSVLALPLPAM